MLSVAANRLKARSLLESNGQEWTGVFNNEVTVEK
jgi:hypothetical protein